MRDTPRILIIDIEKQPAAVALRREKYDVLEVESEAAALDLARLYQSQLDEIHVVCLDPGVAQKRDARPLIQQLRRLHRRCQFIIHSSLIIDDEKIIDDYDRLGVCAFLPKVSEFTTIRRTVRRAIRQVEVRIERDEFQQSLNQLHQEYVELEERCEERESEFQIRLRKAQLERSTSTRLGRRVLRAGLDMMRERRLPRLVDAFVDVVHRVIPSEATLVYVRETIEPDRPARPFAPDEGLSHLAFRTNVLGSKLEELHLEQHALDLARRVANTGSSLRVRRTARESGVLPPEAESFLGVPLFGDSADVIGVCFLYNRVGKGGRPKPAGFSPPDERLLGRIASFLAQGILRNYETGLDPLTHLPNRRKLERRFDEELEKLGGRDEDSRLWYAIADIDDFKKFNTDFGHRVGDAVLCSVGDGLRESVRDDVYRWGGEEFVILLSGLEDDSVERKSEDPRVGGVLTVLNRAREAVADLPCPSKEGIPDRRITVSIGVTRVVPGDDQGSAFERANVALQLAKIPPKNCVRIKQPPG